MSDQDYDVIISNKEYQQYKGYKNTIGKLQIELKQQKDIQHSKDIKINQVQKDNKFKQTEILFLVNLLGEAIRHDKKDKPLEYSVISHEANSISFEVLGQSVMFNKQNQNQLQFKDNQFVKKYNELLVGVTSLSQKIQSQQELITKLNKMNSEINQLLINKNQQQLLNSLKDKLSIDVKSISEIKEIINQSKINNQQKQVLMIQKKKLQETINKLKEQIKKLAQALGIFTEKCKKAQLQNAELKKSLKVLQEKKSVPEGYSSYGDKPYKIKLLIDEHIKDMYQSLGKIGGLTTAEINSMLDAELKSLIQYIPKSMDKK